MKLLFCCCFITLAIAGLMSEVAGGSRILFLTPIGSRSHKNFFMGIAEALGKAGHQVTMVSTHKASKEKENVRDVVLSSRDVTHFMKDVFGDFQNPSTMINLFSSMPDLCVESLGTKEMQELMNEEFDLVILSLFLDFCFLSLSHHFQAPLIYASPAGLIGPFSMIVGSPYFPSVQKNEFLGVEEFPYAFLTRLKSVVMDTAAMAFNEFYIFPRSDKLCREAGLCPPDMPPLKEISNNVSLTLLSRVEALEVPQKPKMLNVINVGGIHCHPAKPLPIDLEEWASTAEHGFIFFSLGSAITPSDISEKHLKILLNVFGSLKQKVLMKWDKDEMVGLPPNVRLGKWLPQQDLLGHKNMKVFITHGGLLSTLEASYHSVPIIGMPVQLDQFSNIAESVSEGWAAQMDWQDLEEEKFKRLIHDVMSNENYIKVAKHRSKVMRDLPRPPAEEAVFWVEYVLRHKGADHIKSPFLKLCTFEQYNIDVWLTIACVPIIFFLLAVKCIKFVLRKCFKKRQETKKKKKE